MHPPPDPLTRLLHRADPAAGGAHTSAADFAAAVRLRIQNADTTLLRSSGAGALRHLYPLAAALALITSLGLGSGFALVRERESHRDALAAAYVRSIDPWTMHAADR